MFAIKSKKTGNTYLADNGYEWIMFREEGYMSFESRIEAEEYAKKFESVEIVHQTDVPFQIVNNEI